MKVGVVLPLGDAPDRDHPVSYREIRELALGAEAGGLDSVWVVDHLLFRFPDEPPGGIWEAWTMLSAIADATTRVDIGTLVLCTAFRNPAVLAKMAVTADEVSEGRLILGIGAGWHEPEFDAFGIPFDHRVSRFEDAASIIVPLLREGRVDHRGRWSQAVDCEMRPRGPRADGPPILIASKGPRMMGLTARFADSWNTCWYGRPDERFLSERSHLAQACEEAGRDPASLEVTVGVVIAREPMKDDGQPKRALSGSAREIADGLAEYAELGVGHVICALDPADRDAVDVVAEAAALIRPTGAAPVGAAAGVPAGVRAAAT